MLAVAMLSGVAVLMAQPCHPPWQFKTKGDVMTSAKPSAKPAAEALTPVELGASRIKFAQGMVLHQYRRSRVIPSSGDSA